MLRSDNPPPHCAGRSAIHVSGLRFIHTADWQIGKPYKAIADDQKRFKLQQERLAAISRIRDLALKTQADMLLVAGDLFDSPTPPATDVLEVLELIGEMTIPVLVIPGNHDHGALGTVWHRDDFLRHQQRMAANLQVLLSAQPLELDQAVVLPCPLLRNRDSRDPCLWLQSLDWHAISRSKVRIVLAHGGVHGFGAKDYSFDAQAQPGVSNLIDLEMLPADQIDYVALGDWHNLKQVNDKAWYPGTPEPDRFDQGEGNQRGQVLQVEVSRQGIPQVEVMATGRLRWHNISFHFNGDPDLDRFERQLTSLTEGRVSRDLLRLVISGSLSLAGHRRYDRCIEDLRSSLLRLRLKGECHQSPEAEELEQLTCRDDDPLIAEVATQLQHRLDTLADADSEEVAITRAALCELFQLTTSG
ncbi:MAG: exonuclease SbcCD subunit D [Prochlorococcus sp.]